MTTAEIEQGLQQWYDAKTTGTGTVRISDVSLLGTGYEADIFVFSHETVEDSMSVQRELVLRLYVGEKTSEKAAREFEVMRCLHGTGFPVPQVFGVEHSPFPFSRPFVIMERIHGVSLGQSYWSGSESRKQVAQETLFSLMGQLHRLPANVVLPDSLSGDTYAFLEQYLPELSTLADGLADDLPHSLRKALLWLDSHRSRIYPEPLSIVHGDFHYNNVLVRPDNSPVVIDWSNIRIGDYRTDLAWLRMITSADATPDGGAAELDLFERISGKKLEDMPYFDALAAVRLLLSVLTTLPRGPLREEGLDFARYVASVLAARTGIATSDIEDALSAFEKWTLGD